MAKRYNRLPIFSTSAKRAKIETSIQSPSKGGVSVNISSKFNIKTSVSSKPITKQPSIPEFDDDDDEIWVCQALSQMEKGKPDKNLVPGFSTKISHEPSSNESFSSFAVGAEFKTSTQMFVQNSKNIPEAKNEWDDYDILLSQFNFDENVAQLAKQKEVRQEAVTAVEKKSDNIPSTSKSSMAKVVQNVEFKVPAPVVQDFMDTSVVLPSQMTVSEEARSNLQQRRQRANELKIKFLEDHVEKLKEMKKKAEEKESLTEKQIKIRESEITSLKYELKQLKTMMDRLRQDKLKDTEKINNEWSVRMSELENKLKLCQMELGYKTAELMNATMKKPSIGTKHNQENVESRIKATDIYGICQQVYTVPRIPLKLNAQLFREVDQKYIIQKEICVKQYDALTMGLSKIFVTNSPDSIILRQVMPAIKSVLRIINRFVLKLTRTNSMEYQLVPSAEERHLAATIHKNRPLILCSIHPHGQPSIYEASENTRDEKILVARRCLAVIAEMCRSRAFVTEILNDSINFLKNLTLIVQIIGTSDEYSEYSSLMTAIMTIAINIYTNSRSSHQNSHDILIFKLIKAIIHCRIMNLVTMHKISEFLRTVATFQDSKFLEYFCNANCATLDKSESRLGIFRFNNSSCVLQVLGLCFETSPRFNLPLDASKINLISEMTINILQFITTSEDQQVTWFTQPAVNEKNLPIRPCVPKMISGFIPLLHTCLQSFRLNPNIIEQKTMCYLAKASVLLLGRIFEQYEQYQIDIFTYGCGALLDVKSSFKIAVSILNQYKMEFAFESIHIQALEILSSPKNLMDYDDEDLSQGPAEHETFDSLDDYRTDYM